MAKVTIGEYPNGRVELIGNSYVYIPNNVSSSTDVTIYYTGAIGDVNRGDIRTASDYIEPYLNDENFDKIIILNNYGSNNGSVYSQSYLEKASASQEEIIATIESEYGVTLDRVNTIGSSVGDKCALYNFAELCREGRDNGFCVITGASTIDGNQTEGQSYTGGPNRAFLSDEDYAAMEGKTVFIFEGSSGTNYSYVKQLVDHGIDVVFVKCKDSGHDKLSYNPLEDNIFDMLDGDPSAFVENDNYTFVRCTDVDSYTWEEVSDDELEAILNNGSSINVDKFLNKEVVKVENLFKVDDFEITEEDSPAVEKYSAIRNINTNVGINLGTMTDVNLASDMIYVTTAMSNLRAQIKSSNFLTGKTQAFRNPEGIPGCICAYINAYYDIMGSLMDSLVSETDAVISVGQAIVDMDNDLASKAEEVDDAGEIVPTGKSEPLAKPEEEPKEEAAPAPSPTPTPSPSPSSSPAPTPSPTPTPEPSKPEEEKPVEEPKEEETPVEEVKEESEETPTEEKDVEEEVILPEVVMGERQDGSKIYVQMEGQKATEVKYTYEYNSEEEVQKAYEEIRQKYSTMEYVKEIKIEGTKIDIIFKEESYKDLDLDTIISKYF